MSLGQQKRDEDGAEGEQGAGSSGREQEARCREVSAGGTFIGG